MARKGSRKVRTGCLTCKIHKVKCDEDKPSCHRCVSTGRKCDGYAPSAHAAPTLRWHRPRSHFPGVNSPAEIRHLQFFWEVAAPGMSGPTDPYFWTNLVLQFGSFEPAARHSLIAISSLYERLLLHDRRNGTPEEEDDGSGVALTHYNAAIRATQAADKQRAARAAPSSPSSLVGVADPVPPAFAGVADAQWHADNLVRRVVRLLRRADPYRLGHLRRNPSGTTDISDARPETICNLLMRFEIARIWAETALERSEMAYDAYIDQFKWFVDEATELATRDDSSSSSSRPVFSFEMAFVPSLFFIAIKCRCLDTRLRALALTLWEVPTVYATGKLIIELEHGVLLDEAGQMCAAASCPGLPTDETRVWEITTGPELQMRVNPVTGVEELGKILGLFMKTAEGNIYLRNEFIVEMV
ncbi:hypothetical protein F4809DRAFT_657943 [Biscogniauxia mediterranea]|nr:hypothetical protein F4809DRAFT_657943 [Biscogniauxia mediterranea]